MGSAINGGVIVGAGNMYDPIDSNSAQLFMMLEFSEATDDLIVVTDAEGNPVFAYDFPYDYTYIAFSTPELEEGETYHVYLGGEIDGAQQDGLYTSISSYTPGRLLSHGGSVAEQRSMGMQKLADMGDQQPEDMEPMQGFETMYEAYQSIDLNELLSGVDLNELLAGKDLNGLMTGFSLTDLLTEEELRTIFGEDADLSQLDMMPGRNRDMGGFGMGGPRAMASSAEVATEDFVLSRESNTFTNVSVME